MVAISSIFDGFVACLAAPLVLWGPEGLAACGSLWRPVAACGARLDVPIEEFGDIEAWGPEASMPGCSVGWLAGLAGWLAGLAGLLAVGGYLTGMSGSAMPRDCLCAPNWLHMRRTEKAGVQYVEWV